MALDADQHKIEAMERLKLAVQYNTAPKLTEAELDAILTQCQHAKLWAAATAFEINDVVLPLTPSGLRYKCIESGTTAASQPIWPKRQGSRVKDGTVTWMEDGPAHELLYDVQAAIHKAWGEKMAKAQSCVDVSITGLSTKDSQTFDHCKQMYEQTRPFRVA